MTEYNQIRAEIHNWSLESDDRLFRKIEMFAQNFLNKVDYLTADVKNTDFNITGNHVELGNAFSKFLNLSNHKFTENKMQPFNDADLLRKSQIDSDLIPLSMDSNSNIVERYQQALNFGMESVNITQYLNQANDDDDRLSVSDAGERSYSIYSEGSVLPGKNNKLPYIIGTRAFLEDDYIGIYENPDQPIKPEILSFQEISLPESNIKVETNYIPKIEQPPPPPPIQNPESEVSQPNNNNGNVPPPPPLLGGPTTGIVVNQTAPPPPPNLLLPGIKPSGNNPPPLLPPPLPNLNNNQTQNNVSIPPPPTQQGGSKVIAPPPLSLLLQNQSQGKSHNAPNINLPPPQMQNFNQNQTPQMQMPPPFQGMPPQNNLMGMNQGPDESANNQNAEPPSFKMQLQAMLARSKPQPPQPQPQEQQNILGAGNMQSSMAGFNQGMPMQNNMSPQMNMGDPRMSQMQMGGPQNNYQSQPNMMMGQQMQMGGPQQGFPPNFNMGGPQMMNQNYSASQNQMSYTYRLSESQMPQVDFNQPIIQNQNFYAMPQNYQPQNYSQPNYQQQNTQPQNFQTPMQPPQMNMMNKPQSNPVPPPPPGNSSNVNVNKKAPPPPNLLSLIEKEKSAKNSKESSPTKPQPKPKPNQQPQSNFMPQNNQMPMQMPNQMPMQMNNQQMPPMQMNNQQMPPMQMNNQQMPMQMNNQQMPPMQMNNQMPMQNPQPNPGMTLQEQLNAAFRKKQLLAAGGESQPSTIQQSPPFQTQPNPNFNQGQMNQTPQTNFMQSAPREDSQFRRSLQALQENQPQQQNNPSQEDNSAQSKANLKARLEQTLAASMGRSFNPVPTMSDRTQTQIDPVGMSRPGPEQQQQTLAPPRVSLKNSKTIDVSQLESKYKPKKKKKGDGLFDDIEKDSEDSGSEQDIFKGEKKRNTKFDDLLTKPIIIVPDPPEEKPKAEIPKPVVKEPLGNTLEPVSQFNAKKIEDSFMVTKSNDVLKNKEDLLEKSKVQEVNKKDKFSSLFANDSDEEDDFKKTQDMNKLYAQEKLKRSATTVAPTSKTNPSNTKVTSLFKDNDSDEDDKGFMAPKQVSKPILKEKKVIDEDEGLAPPVKSKLEKKASVRFNLDDDDEGKNKEKSDEKQKKNALFDDDDQPKPKFEEPKKAIFNPPENKPSKKNEETFNPLAKKSPIFNDESAENYSIPQKAANLEGITKKSSALNFLDEPSEGLDFKKKNPEVREEPKAAIQNPLRPSQKLAESNEKPSKKLFDFDDPTESLGFQKTTKPFEEPTEKKQLPIPPTVSNERPSQKKPLDFDEPSESLAFQKAKPVEKPKEQVIFAAERPSNRNPLAFLDESSEALANEKPKLPEKPQTQQKPVYDFERPQAEQKNTDIFGERPSRQPLQPEVKTQNNFDSDRPSLKTVDSQNQKDIFGGEKPSNKKTLDFLDESSEALTYNKAKSEITDFGLKKDADPEPAFKSKTLKLEEPQISEKKSVEPAKFESNPLARPSEKKETFDPLSRPAEKKDIFDPSRPSQKKDLFPPADTTAKDRPSQLKTDGDNDLPAKRSAKTVTSKIAGLQDKLGNLPIGGMFQKPDDRVMLNLRRKKEEDRRPELDHDLTLDKPTMARKKKPRGQKNADFGESENDKNLNFERTNNAIVVHPEQNEIPEQRESQQNLDNNVSRNSKQKMMFEEEKTSDIFSKPQTKQQPLPNLDDLNFGKKQQPLPNLEDFGSTKKQTKQPLDEMDDFLSSRPSKQNKSIPPPSLPKMDNPPVKKPLKSLLDDSDELPNPPNYKSQQSKQDKPLPKLPDISDDRIDRPSEKKPKEKVSQEIFAESTSSSKQQLPPALPSLSDDKPKKKKNPLDRPSEKEKPPVLEEKKSKKQDIFDDEEVPTKPSIKSKNNFDVPPLPGKLESKSVLPDFKAPTYVAKPGEKESKKLKKLFDDDDDDGDSLFKSSKPGFGNAGGGMSGKKKNLFD